MVAGSRVDTTIILLDRSASMTQRGPGGLSKLDTGVDQLHGFPGEDEETLVRSLDFCRENQPDEVVVNVYLRLYRNLPLTRVIMKDPALHRYLTGPGLDDESMLTPVFYNHVPVERLRELIKDDAIFRIAGAEKVVNYQKA